MAEIESSPVNPIEEINGRPVHFQYEPGSDADSSKLTWSFTDTTQPGAEPDCVLGQDIVTVLPHDVTGRTGLYKLIYVSETTTTQDATQATSNLHLKTLTANRLPQPFLDDFLSVTAGGPAGFQGCWQADQSRPNAHVIVSTGSGTGLAASVWEQLVKPALQEANLIENTHYTLHVTTSDTSVAELTTSTILPQANAGITQNLLVLSGDGGVVDIINSLLAGARSSSYTKPTIVLLPLGTGNALANSAGIATGNTLGLRTAFRGVAKELPLFRASFSPGARLLVNEARDERSLHLLDTTTTTTPVAYGAVVCSWGFHAALVADSDTAEYRKFGAERFKMAAKEALFPADGSPPHAYRGRVSVLRAGDAAAGAWREMGAGEHEYVLATPVSHLEKGFRISPASRPMDGKLRLVHFGPMDGKEVMDIMGKAYQGGLHVEDARVDYEEIGALRIEFDEDDGRWRRICVDGKIIRVEKGGWVEVRAGQKGVVDVLVPKEFSD